MAIVLALVIPGVAFVDDISNNIDATIDSVAEAMLLTSAERTA